MGMNFGRTTPQRCGVLPSSVKFWVTTYDAGENLERVGLLLKLLGQLDGDDVAK